MYTISLATQKGGSGKSSLAIGLALAAIEAGYATRLIETDPLGTLSNWQSRRPYAEPIVEPLYCAGDVEPRLAQLARDGIALAIIDTASGIAAATTAAIRHSDLVLIPARPSLADIEATVSTVELARAWNRPFAFVLNQTPIRGQRIATAASTLAEQAALEQAGVLAQPLIVMRNDHQDSLAAGLSVIEFAPHAKSTDEIRGLWRWAEARLGIVRSVELIETAPPTVPDSEIAPGLYLPASLDVSLAP